jgi:hypothetical protein
MRKNKNKKNQIMEKINISLNTEKKNFFFYVVKKKNFYS